MNPSFLIALAALVLAHQKLSPDDNERRSQLGDELARLRAQDPDFRSQDVVLAWDPIFANAAAQPIETALIGAEPEIAVNPLNLKPGELEYRRQQDELARASLPSVPPPAAGAPAQPFDVNRDGFPNNGGDSVPSNEPVPPRALSGPIGATVVAKFRVDSKAPTESDGTVQLVRLTAVIGDQNPESENSRFFKFTPTGELKLGVLNPDAAQAFDVNKEYLIYFVPVPGQEETAPAAAPAGSETAKEPTGGEKPAAPPASDDSAKASEQGPGEQQPAQDGTPKGDVPGPEKTGDNSPAQV